MYFKPMFSFFLTSELTLNLKKCRFLSLWKKDWRSMRQTKVVLRGHPWELFLSGRLPASASSSRPRALGQRPPESSALNGAVPVAWFCDFFLWLLGEPLLCWLHSFLARSSVPGSLQHVPSSETPSLAPLPPSLDSHFALLSLPWQRVRGQGRVSPWVPDRGLCLEQRLAHGVLCGVLLLILRGPPGLDSSTPLS